MEIRKDSWHYRFFKLAHEGWTPEQTNLCSYFWRTMFGLLVCILLAVVAGALVYGVCWSFYFHTPTAFIVLGLVAVVVGAIWYYEEIVKPRRRQVQPEPGLVVSYLKAKKSKMCPIITFTEIEE